MTALLASALRAAAGLVLALVLLLAAFVAGRLTGGNAEVAVTAAAATRADVLVVDSVERSRRALDVTARSRLATLQAREQAALHRAEEAGQAAEALLLQLDTAQLTVDSLRRIALRLDSIRRRQLEIQQGVMVIMAAAGAIRQGRWEAADSSAGGIQQNLHDALEREEDVARKVRPRPWWREILNDAACAGAGAAAANEKPAAAIVTTAGCLLL